VALQSSFVTTTHQTRIEYHIVEHRDNKPKLLFLNGYRTHFNTWQKLVERHSKDAKLLLYNRLGMGQSSRPVEKQSGDVVVRDLRELLSLTSFSPPYIIVAHSLGGIFAELFIRKYPSEVAGLVLVDAAHAEEIAYMKSYKIPLTLRALNALLQLGDKLRGRYAHSEDQEIEHSLALLQNAGEFPPIPVAVVSGAKKMPLLPDHLYQAHQAFQRKLLLLSPRSRQIICEQSAHFPQLSEPQRLEQAIRDVISEAAA